MQQASDSTRDLWKEKINNQIQSGLSIADWCRQNNVVPHTFYYWRDKLFPKATINRTDFREISEGKKNNVHSQKSGVSLQFQECVILLDQQFNEGTLRRCIKVLKGLL